MTNGLYIGLISGTSVDGIDAAAVSIDSDRISLKHTLAYPFPEDIRREIDALCHPGDDEIERLGTLDRRLGMLFAEATGALLHESGLARDTVRAVGCHGQTVRHRPPGDTGDPDTSFTLQIGDPNTIAERTGLATVADFRRRDIAAGGEGAPLAPAFHAAAFGEPGKNRAIINIGGISNITLLQGTRLMAGYDTGPGNTLLDHWYRRHATTGEFDRDGCWGAGGTPIPALLQDLMQHPYLLQTGPRSTGREAFNPRWLDDTLATHPDCNPRDIQATLAQFSAETIVQGLDSGPISVDSVHICGGGAHNADLMRRLGQTLGDSRPLMTTAALGVDPDWVEAAAFAWLAYRTLCGLPGNAPAVTGASHPCILGAVYPAGPR